MFSRNHWVAGLFLLTTLAAPVSADNVMPKVSDPQENATLTEFASAKRLIEGKFDPKSADALQQIISNHPNWSKRGDVELDLARTLKLTKKPEQALAICTRLRDTYKTSNPSLAAWAQLQMADSLNSMGKFQESAQASKDLALSFTSIDDLQPVLQTLRKLANMILAKKIDESILSYAEGDKNGEALARTVKMTMLAERCDLTGAYKEYSLLKESLPANDKRIAIATARLIISETYAYGRKDYDCKNALDTAKNHLTYLQTSFPNEKWLLNRAKRSIAETLIRTGSQPELAETLLREIIADGSDTAALPTANSLLMGLLYSQHRYEDAAVPAKAVVDNHPYSTWADYDLYFYADCLYRLGKMDQAIAAFDQLTAQYPDSTWSTHAQVMKEVFCK